MERRPSHDRRQNVFMAIFFIWGLVVVQSMVECGTAGVLMIYMIQVMKQPLLSAAIIICSLDGLSSVKHFIFAYVAEAFTSRFSVIIFSTGCYIVGLILLWINTGDISLQDSFQDSRWFNIAVLLIALGKSGQGSILKSFLECQLSEWKNNTPEATRGSHRNNENRTRKKWKNICWHSAWVSGYIIALYLFRKANNIQNLKSSSLEIFQISALAMLAAFVLFFLGFFTFDYENPTRIPFVKIASVLNAATSKKIHLWATFFPYSLVLVTGNSLFLAQVTDMNVHIGSDFMVPFVSFFVLKSFLSNIVVFIFWWKGKTGEGATTVRIGTGLICSVFCCIAAWQVELLRLEKMSSMNVLWLVPQFAMLGLMEGFGGGGLVAHIYNKVHNDMKSFTEPFCELVLCLGKFGSILFMSFCNFWFDKSIESSQLNEYFLMLAILCCVFYVIYLCWWRNYNNFADQ